ncbi:hypothetical protein [Lichenifustis flavocetrariae]|uniref:Uncharacterized protein n=1 Tax=Lichenifustis flavocetrariae TaxID=2949735 RepID=A0AA41Z9S5_9HYPH|nr:hypothetical protein [Lichenifustis flavocetrariae]MCW6511907.1 hypothetical protein [Lichenifustis flavocetrariae]
MDYSFPHSTDHGVLHELKEPGEGGRGRAGQDAREHHRQPERGGTGLAQRRGDFLADG